MTALTLNGSAVAATTLAAAGKLFNATGGTSGNTSTKVGSGTLNKQIFAKGTATNQTGVASIPTPTDSNFNGWMWDVTTLEGQLLQAGTLTPTIHLLASTGTTVTPTVQWFKRTSGGVYTQLATVAGSSIALTTSSQALTFTPPSMSDTPFSTGDKLCMWLWVNQTAGGATNSTISVVEATSASSAGVASEVQTVTQGYIPIVTTTYSFTDSLVISDGSGNYKPTILSNGPIRYYRLNEPSGTSATDLGSQAQNGTINTGTTLGQTGLLAGDSDTAMLFDGTAGSVSLPTTGLPSGASAFSIELWFSVSSPLNANQMLFSMGTVATNEVVFIDFETTGHLGLAILNTNGIAGPIVSLASPHHIVGTYDGSLMTFYVDGAFQGSFTNTNNLVMAGAYIGAYADGASFHLPGVVDELAIYNYALTAATVGTHYTAGAIAPFTSPTSLSGSFTESLTASESLGVTDVALPTDSLTASESATWTSSSPGATTTTYSFTDALVASDSLLILDTAIPLDSLSISSSLLEASTALSTESLTIADTVLGTDGSLVTDGLTASDSLIKVDTSLSTEANSASESFLGSGTSQATESLSTSDTFLKADGYVPLESLSGSSSQVSGGAYLPLEGLTGVTSPLEWDVYLPGDDALSANDSASTMTQVPAGGGVVTTTYSFEDDLGIAESMLTISVDLSLDSLTMSSSVLATSPPSFTEGLIIVESLLVSLGSTPTTSLVASDSLLQTDATLPIESLSTARSMTIQGTGTLLNTLAIAESLLVAGNDLSIDGLIASDFGNMQSWGINALAVTDSLLQTSGALPTENLSISDTLLTTYESAFSEDTSILDAYFLAQGYVPLDPLGASTAITTGGIYMPAEVLALLEHLLGEDSVSWVEDETAASDSFDGEILPAAVLSSHPLGSSPAFYQGQSVVPTRPSGVYAVNGVILDSQPTICTAPLAAQGVRFLAGSTFFLFFQRPTTLTQSLLANGQTVSMTFALANGQMVTGRVQVASTFVAATSLSVLCTLLSADVALAL